MHRETLKTIYAEGIGDLRLFNLTAHFEKTPGSSNRLRPGCPEHTDEILRGLGYSDGQIASHEGGGSDFNSEAKLLDSRRSGFQTKCRLAVVSSVVAQSAISNLQSCQDRVGHCFGAGRAVSDDLGASGHAQHVVGADLAFGDDSCDGRPDPVRLLCFFQILQQEARAQDHRDRIDDRWPQVFVFRARIRGSARRWRSRRRYWRCWRIPGRRRARKKRR